MKRCGIRTCVRTYYAKGWCRLHWERERRTGSAHTMPRVRRLADERFDGQGNRWCTLCQDWQPVSEFEANVNARWCRECRRLRRHGLTRETFALLPGADGICPICLIRESTRIDHDHACCPGRQTCGQCVRGVLCHSCNVALGMLTDDGVARALSYLQDARTQLKTHRTEVQTHVQNHPHREKLA